MSIESRRAVQHVVSLVLFEVAAVAGLHVIGTRSYVGVDWFHISRWLATTPTDQVVMSLAWLVALVLAWWTLGSTLLYLITRVRAFRAGARIAERLAFPMVRQVIDRAVATTVVTSVLLGTASPALADQRPPPPVTQQAPATVQYEPEPAGPEESEPPSSRPGPGRAPRPVERPSREEQPSADDRPGDARPRRDPRPGPGEDAAAAELNAEGAEGNDDPARASEAATEDEQAEPDRRAERRDGDKKERDRDRDADNRGRRRSTPQPGSRYTVRAGDHLWKIAVAVVSPNGDGKGDRNAVASYWAELVRVATPHLQSGDPNLIYPGEELELPPLRHRTGDRK